MQTDALHHSRFLQYRSPQGAAKAGQQVALRLWTGPRFMQTRAVLRLWIQDREERIPMRSSPGDGGQWHEASVRMPDTPGLAWYYFVLEQPNGETLFYGGESGEGALYSQEPPGYQITVYDPAFTTPRWFREGIVYQIFPDRFSRSRTPPENPGVAYHRALGRSIRIHADWEDAPEYLPEPGQPDYRPNDFFCGDLWGVIEKLPYLETLGVSCIYLNPIFESASNHRYDTADYTRVDPMLGGDEALFALTRAATERGMRIMLDGVFSHTGADSVYFNKYGRYADTGAYQSAQSPYRSWYEFNPEYPNGYRSWWGFPELPEVNEGDASYLSFVMDGQESLLGRRAAQGVTSWRLDVADELPDAFLMRLRERLKTIDPEGVLLGEVWEDASIKVAYGALRAYVQGHTLDCVMNYPFRAAAADFLLYQTDAHGFNLRLQTLRERYPKPFYYAAMNLLSTHDTVRALTMLSGAPDRDALTRAEQAAFVLEQGQRAQGRARLLLACALQMAMPGAPSIYYGDEVGMSGMADPFNRGTYPWGNEDAGLLAHYRALTRARQDSAALRAGYCRMGALTPDVFTVLRYTADGRDAFGEEARDCAALLLVNRSEQAQDIRLRAEDLMEGEDAAVPVTLCGSWRDTLTEQTFTAQGDTLQVRLAPMGTLLLLR